MTRPMYRDPNEPHALCPWCNAQCSISRFDPQVACPDCGARGPRQPSVRQAWARWDAGPEVAPPTSRVKWFAATGAIAKAGPFDSQVDAWRAIRLSDEFLAASGTRRPFADNAIVWPEEEETP